MEADAPLTMVMIRREFQLPNDEDLFDDFKCTLNWSSGAHLGSMTQGRLYITDQYMCFSSNLLGVTQKVKLKFQDIKSIKRMKTMGIFNSGIIVV
jgi:hypothetical protein|tara:strand:+ start:136 stop:420 length:285 start_codon:yes stop_codon:yes gene_type:complete